MKPAKRMGKSKVRLMMKALKNVKDMTEYRALSGGLLTDMSQYRIYKEKVKAENRANQHPTISPEPEAGPRNCVLCLIGDGTQRHHVIPISILRLAKMGFHRPVKNPQSFVQLCAACHKLIHKHYSNIELAEKYNTLKKLREGYAAIPKNI